MSLFAIADLHLSLGANKPMDVFHGWENYTLRLQQNWQQLVAPQDTVVIAGDISWAMHLEDCAADFSFLHALPGKKLILKGNHDYWWTTRAKMDRFLLQGGYDDLEIIHNTACVAGETAVCGTRGWLYRSETDDDRKIVAREAGRLRTSIEQARALGKKPVVFLHYPPVYDGMECTQLLDVLLSYGITDCYFGHIHGTQAAKKAVAGEYRGIRMHLISCDYLKFMPLLVAKY